MTTYAIGDVQGCFDELQALLEVINFRPDKDQLWFAGDMVNRGPKSLQTLRFVRKLGAITVLGNHDLHLLASAYLPRFRKRRDTLEQITSASDGPELLDWLRQQPLIHHDPSNGYSLIHAGLPPQWDLKTALACAHEVEAVLQGDSFIDFFKSMYGNQPSRWSKSLHGQERLRFITNCFTRLRYCSKKGELALGEKGAPGTQAKGLVPWYETPGRKSRKMKILFGHWSTLGVVDDHGVHSLDTGCLWGGKLTALRLGKKPRRMVYDCPGAQRPKSSSA